MEKLIFCYYWRLHYYNLLFALTLVPSLCTILSIRMNNLDINHHSFSVFYFFLLVFGWAGIEHRGLGMQSKHHSTTEVYILPRQCLLNVYRFPFFFIVFVIDAYDLFLSLFACCCTFFLWLVDLERKALLKSSVYHVADCLISSII